jgi:pimeloyl-ACP methyl ester carboxylesterase
VTRSHRSRRPVRLQAAGALALALLLSGCLWNAERRVIEDTVDQLTDETFYTLPADVPAGEPGSIVRSLPIESAPLGSDAWRVIYHTRDLGGAEILASAVIVVPEAPVPDGGTPVVSWGHPTTGAATSCAPSLLFDPFLLMTGMHEFLAAGYAMVATDYPGMAVEGDSSYLVGVTEGNAMLDAVRAARTLSTGLSNRVLLWGHSQGGQAALFAGQQAKAGYAPDLQVDAIAVAAPAADLTQLMSDDIGAMEGVTISAYAFPSYEAAYADRFSVDELRAVLTPAGAEAVDRLASLCLFTQGKELHTEAGPLVGKFVTSSPATTEPWKTLLEENSAGGSPLGVPVFIGQGLADTTVDPDATQDYVHLLCSSGEKVEYRTFSGITHLLAGEVSMPHVLEFFAGALAGAASATSCGS